MSPAAAGGIGWMRASCRGLIRAPLLREGKGTKWPKEAAKIVDDQEELLGFYPFFSAEHWGAICELESDRVDVLSSVGTN